MVGVSPFKGRLMDEIPDAEYKVVEHQIARPLDPSPRWRFQRLACAAPDPLTVRHVTDRMKLPSFMRRISTPAVHDASLLNELAQSQ